MKKRYLLFLLLFTVIMITGCVFTENKKKENSSSSETVEEKEDSLKIDGYDLSLTEKGSFKELSYMFPEGTVVNSLGTYTILAYSERESSNTLFKIGFSHYSNKSIDEVMNSDKLKLLDTKTYNGITWNHYEVEGKYHNYAMKNGSDVYAIDFIYDKNLQEFEEEFMKHVKVS